MCHHYPHDWFVVRHSLIIIYQDFCIKPKGDFYQGYYFMHRGHSCECRIYAWPYIRLLNISPVKVVDVKVFECSVFMCTYLNPNIVFTKVLLVTKWDFYSLLTPNLFRENIIHYVSYLHTCGKPKISVNIPFSNQTKN